MAMNNTIGFANQVAGSLGFNGQNGQHPVAQLSSFINRAGNGQIGAGCAASGGIANSRTPADTARLQQLAQQMGFKDCGCGCKGAKALTKLLQKMKAQQGGQGQGQQGGGCNSCGGGQPGQANGAPEGWKPGLDANAMRHNENLTNNILNSAAQQSGGCQGGPPPGGDGFRCMGFPGGNALPSGCCCGNRGPGGGLGEQLRLAMNLV